MGALVHADVAVLTAFDIRWNQAGYTAEIGRGTLRLTVAAPEDSDDDVYEFIRCDRLVDY